MSKIAQTAWLSACTLAKSITGYQNKESASLVSKATSSIHRLCLFAFFILGLAQLCTADGWFYEAHPEYFENVLISSSSLFLRLSQGDLATFSSLKVASMPEDHVLKGCSIFFVKNRPGCYLHSAASGCCGQVDDFLIKSTENGQYEIFVSSAANATVWISPKENPNFHFSVVPILQWLGAYVKQGTGKSIVRSNPTDSAPIVVSCEFSDIPKHDTNRTWGFTSNMNLQQDWMEQDWVMGSCKKSDCYAADLLPCGDDMNKEKSVCKQGWVRWRSADGHLLLYPSYFYCD